MNAAKQEQVQLAYESWEHLLYTKVSEFEYFLDDVKADLSCVGMSRKESSVYLDQKIAAMREDIALSKERSRSKRRAV